MCWPGTGRAWPRSEEHTSELQSRFELVCRLLLEKKKEHPADRGSPQISIEQQSLFFTAKCNREVERKDGLAFTSDGGGDQDDLVWFVEIIERDGRADRAYGLGETRIGFSRLLALAEHAGHTQGRICEPRLYAEQGTLEFFLDIPRALDGVVQGREQEGHADTEQQGQQHGD